MLKTTISTCLYVFIFILWGCEENEADTTGILTDGFCIVSDDKVVLNHHDIEFYDYAAHLIYLKNPKTFNTYFENIESFKVYAGGEEIYTGNIHPAYSSTLPSTPVIGTQPTGYNDYIIPIRFMLLFDKDGNKITDPREDERIVAALKKYSQYNGGLKCSIEAVSYSANNKLTVELTLTNNDTFEYYYLNPEKMGIGLFHYFTTGIHLIDYETGEYKFYNSGINSIQPEPYDTWHKEWLSVINGDETKNITITYDDFEKPDPGTYKASFTYPGLSYQVTRDELLQANGVIWLGESRASKNIVIK